MEKAHLAIDCYFHHDERKLVLESCKCSKFADLIQCFIGDFTPDRSLLEKNNRYLLRLSTNSLL